MVKNLHKKFAKNKRSRSYPYNKYIRNVQWVPFYPGNFKIFILLALGMGRILWRK